MNVIQHSFKRPRRSSSESDLNVVNMADQSVHVEHIRPEESAYQRILADIADLKQGQHKTRKFLESEIGNIIKDFKGEITRFLDEKITNLQLVMDNHLHTIDNRITQIECSVESLSTQVEHQNNPLKDTDRCVIASGIQYQIDENIEAKVGRLIAELGPHLPINVEVIATERLKARSSEHIPLVRIAFGDVQQKISVLKAKQNLAKSQEFRKVRLRSSKTHVERILEMNFKTIMEEFPDIDNKFRIANNGKLIPKEGKQVQRLQNNTRPTSPLNTGFSNTAAGYETDFPPLQHSNLPRELDNQMNSHTNFQKQSVIPPRHSTPNVRPQKTDIPNIAYNVRTPSAVVTNFNEHVTQDIRNTVTTPSVGMYRPPMFISDTGMEHNGSIAIAYPPPASGVPTTNATPVLPAMGASGNTPHLQQPQPNRHLDMRLSPTSQVFTPSGIVSEPQTRFSLPTYNQRPDINGQGH